jgi:hypothetical protein
MPELPGRKSESETPEEGEARRKLKPTTGPNNLHRISIWPQEPCPISTFSSWTEFGASNPRAEPAL